MNLEKFQYITTTLPYANGEPHLGHMFEFLIGDCLARYYRLKKDSVYFNIGLDEHGQKIYDKAITLNIAPQEYVDSLYHSWIEFCTKFDISYDNFYRTSSPEHKIKVQVFWNKLLQQDLIYKKQYEGRYCIGCESFKTEKDLINNKCPDHLNLDIQDIAEENYFFRLSKYKEALFKWLEESSFLLPKSKTKELWNIIDDSEDISISRKNLGWGIPVPNDNTQTIYVWFEALLNYIFSAGYLENDTFTKKWANAIQICGPDNLRFQGHIFQSFLAAAKISHTKKLIVHGTILDHEGHKFSKSLGNTIDPIEQLEEYGLTAVRYYALAKLNLFTNASWSEVDLINAYNNDLANDYGNLISRVLHLIDTKKTQIGISFSTPKETVYIEDQINIIADYFSKSLIGDAAITLNALVKWGNKYISDERPFDKDSTNCSEVLNNLYYLLVRVTQWYEPFFPGIISDIQIALYNKKKIILFPKI
jgi:methionyl-tRNA synthetase